MKRKIQNSKFKTCVSRFTFHVSRKRFHASRFTLHEKGFTLIELLISITIIGILSSLVMANIGFGNRQQNLLRAAQQLALDIRRAQNLSLAPTGNAPTPCVYGLKINTATSYFIYKEQDCDGGHLYNESPPFTASEIIETVTIGKGIQIFPFPPTATDIAFEAPEPITWIGGAKDGSLTITLLSPDNTSKTVTVNRFGQVEIQ